MATTKGVSFFHTTDILLMGAVKMKREIVLIVLIVLFLYFLFFIFLFIIYIGKEGKVKNIILQGRIKK